MNQKAQRTELQFPPLLNLQDDRPHIASDFRSVEKLNAPYLNGMLTPLWRSEYEYTNKPVYDYNNNRYEIINGWLTKNGINLFPVDDFHFEKEDVTEQFQDYLEFDFDLDGNLAKLEWDTDTNSVSLTYNNVTVTESNLFVNGVILTSRVRCLGNTAIGVVVYEVNKTLKMLYMNTASNRKQIVDVTWCTTTPKTASDTNTFVNTAITIQNPAPVINIANPLSNVYGISLVSNYGEVLYTRKEGYFTFVDNNGAYIYGTNWAALGGSSTETIRNYQYTNFIFSYQNNSISEIIRIFQKENVWYYVSNPTVAVPDTDSINFNPKPTTETFEYEGVTYQVSTATRYTNRIIVNSSVDDLHSNTASLRVALNKTETSLGPTNYTDNAVSFDYSFTDWLSWNLAPVGLLLTYNSTEYNLNQFVRQYSITEELAPTTVSANYITAPQVFLDNGNLYSWYTIPEAASNSGAQPITFPANTLLVESGTLTAISGNNYTFDTIEAHLVNSYTVNGRSNSIAVDQNFWSSSNKMSVGIRAPYDIYVAKTGSDSYSSSVKYTEYSNSNCMDMLYYAGTVPRNDQLFFVNATAGSQDVAWFNPGGFRAPLKGNWHILYYVDSVGAVSIQGLSYAENENKMGTLVTPLASISDVAYIAASDDFIVYCDSNNRYWKISIEEGAELSSIFDNHYIIANTTSYWNMWDSEKNTKFHYATDYNNRTKFGQTRTKYRVDPTWFTRPDRRRFATAINPNYNILPRLPVTSIIPAAIALGLTLENIIDDLHTYQSEADEAREVQAIDVYFQGVLATDTSTKYVASIKSFIGANQIYRDGRIVDTVYGTSTSLVFIADIFSKYINGAGNNDFIVENSAKYPLVYNSQNKPTFLYSLVSGIESEGAKWFFVIQGQYYAVIGEKLYAMIYNNGYISQSDAIVDIRDMKYVGNTPAIAFFVNPYTKQIYSFTGDANLQQIFDGSKFSFELVNDEITHWYDESTQSIYIKTDKGLLVFGPQNTYLLEKFTDTIDIEFTKGDIHIIGSKVDTLRYYHDVEDYVDLPIELETSFYGIGSNESTTIDRWNVTLYDPEHREQDVEFQIKSLTDVSAQSETKKLHINSNDWDKWSHSVLLSYSPKLIKGQGLRLGIKSHSAIQKIVPHTMDNSTGTTTNRRFET